jgi:hypothetical protein
MNVARPMPTMNETGHPIWILLFLIGLIPLATITELVAAIGSKRVRAFIVDHPFAHNLVRIHHLLHFAPNTTAKRSASAFLEPAKL